MKILKGGIIVGNKRVIRLVIMAIVILGILSFVKIQNDKVPTISKNDVKQDIIKSCKELGKNNVNDLEIGKSIRIGDSTFMVYSFTNNDGWNYLGGIEYKVVNEARYKRVGNRISQYKDNINIHEKADITIGLGEIQTLVYGKNSKGKSQTITINVGDSKKVKDVTIVGTGDYFIEKLEK